MTPTTAALRRRTRDRRQAAEQVILDATQALLAEKEFRELTVEDVMATTGLTRTSFYRYFPDLDAALLRWLSILGDDLRRCADQWLQDAASGIESGVELVTLYKDHGRLLLAFEQAAGAGTEIDEAWRAVIQSFIDRYSAFIVELRDRGWTNVEQPEQTARALVCMTERYLLETYGRGPAVDVDVAAATLAEIWQRTLFSSGITKPPATLARPPSRP